MIEIDFTVGELRESAPNHFPIHAQSPVSLLPMHQATRAKHHNTTTNNNTISTN